MSNCPGLTPRTIDELTLPEIACILEVGAKEQGQSGDLQSMIAAELKRTGHLTPLERIQLGREGF